MKRMRYIVGGALILGIAAGVWLGDFLKGLGLGTGNGVGIGSAGTPAVQVSTDPGSGNASSSTADLGVSQETTSAARPESLSVYIQDRNYYLRVGTGESPIDLPALVAMARSTTGDGDGIKVRIYQTGSARVTALLQLRDALKTADIPEAAIYTSPEVLD